MLKFSDFFDKKWICQNQFVTCLPSSPEKFGGEDWRADGHESCGWRYVANINAYEYEQLKDARLVK